jgi:hypothetical protein
VGSKKNYNTMMAYPKVGGLPGKVVPVGAPEVAKFWLALKRPILGVFSMAQNTGPKITP